MKLHPHLERRTKAEPASPFWTLSYMASGRRMYCVRGGPPQAEITSDPKEARRFASREEAADAIREFTGWIIAKIEPYLVGEEPASPPKRNLPWRHVGTEGGWDGVADSSGSLICRLALNIPDNATFIADACSKYEETARQRDDLAVRAARSEAQREDNAESLTDAISELDKARASVRALKKQRDELLAACGVLMDCVALARCQPEKGAK